MLPNPKLINALYSVANKIESGEYEHVWSEIDKCNVGLLAKELGVEVEPEAIQSSILGNWTSMAKYYKCSTTGEYLNHILYTLYSNGVEEKDIEEIEFLGYCTELEWMDYPARLQQQGKHAQKNEVIKFFRTKARQLQTQRVINQTKSQSNNVIPIGVKTRD
jgi:hypothetical protein